MIFHCILYKNGKIGAKFHQIRYGQHMKTLCVASLKGGSGKSTIAMNLAITYSLGGSKTLLVDIDKQKSSTEATKGRTYDHLDITSSIGSKLHNVQFNAVKQGYDLIVVDTPAGSEEEILNAVVLSDLIILVIRPTILDLSTAATTNKLALQLSKPLIAVISQAPPSRDGVEPKSVRSAIRVLDALNIERTNTLLRSRQIYQTSLETGRAVTETEDLQAATEINGLLDEIRRTLSRQK